MTSHLIDVQARLRQMASEDPNGSQAEALLRRLTIFEGTFDATAVAALSGMNDPEAMMALATLQTWGLLGRVAVSEPLPIEDRVLNAIPPQAETFATLQAWGFLERETVPKRYFLLKSVIRALPPHKMDAERHYQYYRRLYNYDMTYSRQDRYPAMTIDWPNIYAALIWGFEEHSPKTAIEFAWNLYPYIRDCLSPDKQRAIFRQIQAAGERQNNVLEQGHVMKALGDLALRENDLPQALACYQEARAFYDQDSRRYVSFFNLMSELKALEDTLETANNAYAHTAVHHTNIVEVSKVVLLYHLHDVLMKRGDFDEALDVMLDIFMLYEQFRSERGQCDTLTNLGQTAAQAGDMDRARDYFAWALRMGERLAYSIGQMRALWAWGQAEYRNGQTAAGCALCRQAIVVVLASERINDHTRANDLRTQLDTMDCE